MFRSPDGAQRNPGISPRATTNPDFASLHPGYCISANRYFSVALNSSENASLVRSSLSGVTET